MFNLIVSGHPKRTCHFKLLFSDPGRTGSVPGSESALVITEPKAGQKEAPDFGVRGSHEKNGKIAFGQ